MLEMTFADMAFRALLIAIGFCFLYCWDNRKRFRHRDPSLLSGRMMAFEIIVGFILFFVIILLVQVVLKGLEFYFTVIKAPGGFYP